MLLMPFNWRRGRHLANLGVRVLILIGCVVAGAPALAADPLPTSGAAKFAAYAVCRSVVIVDMEKVGSKSSAECTGIVKTRDGSKLLDNLAIRCIEESKARQEATSSPARALRPTATGTRFS